MGQRLVDLDRRDSCRQGGVGVAIRENPVGTVREEGVLQSSEHGAGLIAVRAAADGQVLVGGRNVQVSEEHVGQIGVVVLTGVHDDVLMPLRNKRMGHRCQLDELWAGTDHTEDLHRRTLLRHQKTSTDSNAQRRRRQPSQSTARAGTSQCTGAPMPESR